MRTSTIWMAFGLCGALSTAACSSAEMQKLKKEVVADVKQAAEIKKDVEAIKKGDTGAIADTSLSVAVKGALTKDAETKGAGIEVEVKDSVVHLKGSGSAEIKAHAEKVAKGVPGVGKVVNEIKAPGAKDDDDDKKRANSTKDAKDSKDAKDDKRANSTKDAKDSKDAKDDKASTHANKK